MGISNSSPIPEKRMTSSQTSEHLTRSATFSVVHFELCCLKESTRIIFNLLSTVLLFLVVLALLHCKLFDKYIPNMNQTKTKEVQSVIAASNLSASTASASAPRPAQVMTRVMTQATPTNRPAASSSSTSNNNTRNGDDEGYGELRHFSFPNDNEHEDVGLDSPSTATTATDTDECQDEDDESKPVDVTVVRRSVSFVDELNDSSNDPVEEEEEEDEAFTASTSDVDDDIEKLPLRGGVSWQPEMGVSERPNLEKQERWRSSTGLKPGLKKRKSSKRSFRFGRGFQSSRLLDLDRIRVIDEKKDPPIKSFRWWHLIFVFSAISVIACLFQLFLPPPYGVMMTSSEVAAVGVAPGCEDDLEHCICPRETICATDQLSIILLTLARCSAFFDYPLYMMLFISKAHNLNNHLRRTLLREWVDFGAMHKIHKIFGIVVGIETMSHSFFHLLRWGLNNQISLLWQTATGITGFIAAAAIPMICLPMVVPLLKKKIKFEVRKGLHYLSIVWAIALLFHAPSRIPWLIGTASAVYAVDHLFGYYKKNNLIETAYFERYGENGVAVHFKNPKSWENRSPTSFVLIMCPWISKYQWHAFTMFPEPSTDNHSMLCINSGGDWTKQLYEKIQTPCFRQLYVHGPFMTEFSDTAVKTSNAIAVASGIGITPTISLIMNYAGRKRINMIWGCRDPGLIEFILHKVDIESITKNSFVFIFYTGKRELALPQNLPANVFIFNTRPNLEETITGIITAIHSGEGLPEQMYEKQEKLANTPFRKRMMIAISRVRQTYDENEMFAYAVEETERAAKKKLLSRSRAPTLTGFEVEDEAIDLESGRRSSVNRRSSPQALGIPKDQVSLVGLEAMISQFLGAIGEYSHDDIEDMFRAIDKDGSNFICREEFGAFLRLVTNETDTPSSRDIIIMSSMVELTDHEVTAFQPKSMHNLMDPARSRGDKSVFGDSKNSIEYMKNLMNDSSGEKPLEDWSIFYCGGSNAIKKNLKEISKRYDIDLAVEKFDW